MSSGSPPSSRPRFKYPLHDPRMRPSSASPQAQATFLRRLERIRASQPAISRAGRIARGSSIASNIIIPILTVYLVFFADWGPHEHVFSGPQRWMKRQRKKFWSLPSDGKAKGRTKTDDPSSLNVESPAI